MKSRLRTAIISAMAAALILSGCGTGQSAPEGATGDGPSGTLRVNWGGGPTTWAPGSQTEVGYMRVPYENLVTLGEGGEILPNLATSWENEGTTVTLELRDDVTFHDGTPFDAEAVRANLEYVRDNPGSSSGLFRVIDQIEVVDEHSVRIQLSRPTPSFMTTLTQRGSLIASPAALADGSITSAPVGTGPWAFDADSSIDGTKWTFQLTDDYWGEEPGFETIELYAIADDTAATAALISGEIDITDTEEDQAPRLESAANVDTLEYPAVRNNLVFFDRGPDGVFGDVDVRRALCTAIDQEPLYDLPSVGTMETPNQHFLEGDFGYAPDIDGFPTDVDEAGDLLGGETVEATIPAAPFQQQLLDYYSDQMNQLDGVDITVQSLAVPEWLSTWNSGQYPLGIGQNNQMTPYDWYNTWFSANGGANPSGYESPELAAAADAAIAAGSTEEADGLWQRVMEIIIDDEANACAFSVASENLAWNTDAVSGVAAPSEPYEVLLVNYRDLEPVAGS